MNTAAMAIEIESLLCFLLKVRFWKFRKNPITLLFQKLYSHICTPIVTPLEKLRNKRRLRNKKIVTNCTKMNHVCHDSQITIISPSIWKYDGTSENLQKKEKCFLTLFIFFMRQVRSSCKFSENVFWQIDSLLFRVKEKTSEF